MLQVIRGFVCRDTVALAKWFVEQALSGNLLGMAVCFRLARGEEEFLFTGAYKARPENALAAAARMYRTASKVMDAHKEQRR
jgi:hypothetical protein